MDILSHKQYQVGVREFLKELQLQLDLLLPHVDRTQEAAAIVGNLRSTLRARGPGWRSRRGPNSSTRNPPCRQGR